MQHTQLIPIMVAALAFGCTVVGGGGTDDVGEEIDQTPDGPADLTSLWPDARVRQYGTFSDIDPALSRPFGKLELDVNNNVIGLDPTEPEWTPFIRSTPPLPAQPLVYPARPHPRGVPDLSIMQHPNIPDVFDMTIGAWASVGVPAVADPRSWLIGNFAVYVPVSADTLPTQIPSVHPRPPGLSDLLTSTLNPYRFGRVNGVGIGCNINRLDWANATPKVDEHHDCKGYVEAGVSAAAPQWPTIDYTMTSSMVAATCLHNGGGDGIEDSIVHAVAANRGLVWLNVDNYDDLVTDVIELAPGGDEVVETWEAIQSVLDAFEEIGLPLTSDTTLPYFTDSGVCGFKAGLMAMWVDKGVMAYESLVTEYACPWGHFPVFKPFDEAALIDGIGGPNDPVGDQPRVDGYCAVSFYGNDPEAAAESDAPMAVLPPEASAHDTPEGVLMYSIDFDVVNLDMLRRWESLVSLTMTDAGISIAAKPDSTGDTAAGQRVLDQFGLLPGDVIASIDSDIDLRGQTSVDASAERLAKSICDEAELDCIDGMTAIELAYWRLDTALARYDVVTLWVRRGTEWRPTYLRALPSSR